MPRNSAGTYSLPAGNPVVTGTTISSTWANTTLTDIANAMTDSLSRSGDGGMQASLQLDSGLIGAPGLSWVSEPTSGLYRSAAGDFRYSISSADKVQITTNGLRTVDGAVGTPGFSFISDTDTGLYRSNTNELSFGTAGVQRGLIGPNGNWTINAPASGIALALNGVTAASVSAGVASVQNNRIFTFLDSAGGTTNCAFLWYDSSNIFNIGSGNNTRISIVGSTGQVQFVDGSAATPSISYSADTDTGFFRAGANNLQVTAGNSAIVAFANTGSSQFLSMQGTAVIFTNDGSAANPSYSFGADPDTGFYRDTANQIAIALAGAAAGQIAQGTYTGTLTGCTTSPTNTVAYQRVGNHVILTIPAVSGTSNANSMTITGAPAVIRPSGESGTSSVANVFNNTGAPDDVPYSASMSSGGTITFYRGISGSVGFTASGTKGISTTNGASGTTFVYKI